jgi:hypothetical protein
MLWQSVIFLDKTYAAKRKGSCYLVENVAPYYNDLVKFNPSKCLTMGRHLLWTNLMLFGMDIKKNFNLKSFSSEGRIRDMSPKNMREELFFDIAKHRNIKNKRQVLRNMFEPKIAEYAFGFIDKEIADREIKGK